jgi:hypothetical protein
MRLQAVSNFGAALNSTHFMMLSMGHFSKPTPSQQGGGQVRARNTLAITLQCAAYNARRLVWLVESAGASARPA